MGKIDNPALDVDQVRQSVIDALNSTDRAALWNVLKRTDPKATKPFQRQGGFRGTQIDPAWRLQTMTEVFGPVGKGWGWEQLEWTIAERMVFICCRVWYTDPVSGEKYFSGPQWGGTEMIRKNKDGVERPDDEAFKMSMTDAIGKCFLQLGLAADIYLGQYDDSKYREESETIYRAKDKDKEEDEKRVIDRKWHDAICEEYANARTLDEITAINYYHKSTFQMVGERNRGIAMQVKVAVEAAKKRIRDQDKAAQDAKAVQDAKAAAA
jgi:hypothetical protein